ncbi:MAG: hydantoinase B/oxoprolinase family protein [Fibrobacteria bacterium]
MDQGGTFTDCIGVSPENRIHISKVLSAPKSPLACIRKILSLRDSDPIPPCEIRLGTTLATNALLERRGRIHALLINEGFADALAIGTQQRPDLFALDIRKPPVLYSQVIEVRGRLEPDGRESLPLDAGFLESELFRLRGMGVEGLAIVLLHGYAFPAHEMAVAECARRAGFTRISCSHEVNPEIGLTARGDTTTVDAYLTPLLAEYLDGLRGELPGSALRLMQSHGGLAAPERFRGHNAILSGPAGGAVACAALAKRASYPRAIGFDMGGTSTDVSRYAQGAGEKTYEWEAAGMRIRSPSLDIHTVAAGGGSLCRVRAGRLTVGPESAGADPGPICYGKGGDLAVTDVNLFLGRLPPDNFPFPLHAGPVAERIESMRAGLQAEGQDISGAELAAGFLEIVNRQMAQAIKDISLARGHEAGEHTLICFGGAGGQHACAVARLLGIRRIALHPLGGVLSAFGMGLAATRWEGSAPVNRKPLGAESLRELRTAFLELEAKGRENLRSQGYLGGTVSFRRLLDLRYRGTEHALAVAPPEGGEAPAEDWQEAFTEAHRKLYGYTRPGREVEILQMRVEAAGEEDSPWPETRPAAGSAMPAPLRTASLWTQGRFEAAPVYRREDLPAGPVLTGPALILEPIATVVLEPGFRAHVDEEGVLLIDAADEASGDEASGDEASGDEASGDVASRRETCRANAPALSGPVLLELFNHAFMAIAGHMGKVLQRTALSTNIKERLDFSCAVFDAEGNLVANAPHIPVHLGAMGESVRHILRVWPHPGPGDVFATNNPYRGGSHLPDITVVTPVFLPGTGSVARPAFFTANRAHHADVGGITPGSMPAFSARLEEEGILLDAEKMISQGLFQSEAMEKLFRSGPFPARNPAENLADLEAQAAANQAGWRMLVDLAEEHGLDQVRTQMERLRANAARQVREALARLPDGEHAFADALDDGTRLEVRITLAGGTAVVDFTGSGSEIPGNLNAPPAVVRSAVMYVLRCLVAERMPMNEGCLDPMRILLPEASILNPSPGRAVVGGNVETSQRVVDCLLGALGLAAASQGTMNNVTFGDETFGYYETLAGGAGAVAPQGKEAEPGHRPGAHGASALHTHMTNTRITDPEVLETRYPVRLERFEIRRGSGGQGNWNGGDGLVRHYRFLKPVEVSLLTQRRIIAPFGLAGGEDGARGMNIRVTAAGERAELPGATSYLAEAGEELIIVTPGGGAFGQPPIS